MQQNAINPDAIIQQAIQAKLNTYQAREHFEAHLKAQNDSIDAMATTIGLMKNRILELEAELKSRPPQEKEKVSAMAEESWLVTNLQ